MRRLSLGDRHETIEPRVMQVLIALTQAQGRVLSRDALIETCWGGRIVGDDAINRCVGKIRQLSELSPGAFEVETIPRIGYRLFCDSSASPDIAAPIGPHPVSPAEVARDWRYFAAPALVLTLLAAAIWLDWPLRHWSVASGRVFIATLDIEVQPSFSPNGAMVAYSAGAENAPRQIFVRNVNGGDRMQITAGAATSESAVWASDNVRIAFVSTDGEQPCRIMVTSLPAGPAREAGRCAHDAATSLAWLPNSDFVYYSDRSAINLYAIFRLNIVTGQKEQVTFPQTRDGTADNIPRISPDGRWLAYLRQSGLAGNTLRVRNLRTGEERRLGGDPDVASEDWSDDSQTVIASISGEMGAEIQAYPIDTTPPYRLYTTATAVRRLATGHGGLLALEVDAGRSNLARALVAPQSQPDIVDASNGQTNWPSFSRDGTLAFVSNRSGENAVWIKRPDGEAAPLFRAGIAASLMRPVWSPDGRQLAFVTIGKGRIRVHVMTLEGDIVSTFDVPSVGFGMPTWTLDGRSLILFDKRILRAVRIEVHNPAHRVPFAGQLWDGIKFHNGAIYSVRAEKDGIWRLGPQPRLIAPNYPAAWDPPLTFRGSTVLIPDLRGGLLRILAQPLDGGPQTVAFYTPGAQTGTAIALDPKSGDLLYVSAVAQDTNIDLLTLIKS